MENPINILVVEDDTNINNLLKTALEKAGYQVIQAFSGTEAELVLQMQKSVSLVLLDLMLPGISGEEVLKSIREKGNLPVIVLTAKDSLDEKIGLLTQGPMIISPSLLNFRRCWQGSRSSCAMRGGKQAPAGWPIKIWSWTKPIIR